MITFKISRIGMRKANVLPLPVTASAATSFFWSRSGITAAWIWSKRESLAMILIQLRQPGHGVKENL